jgi:hypothetical protein
VVRYRYLFYNLLLKQTLLARRLCTTDNYGKYGEVLAVHQFPLQNRKTHFSVL